MESEQPSYIIVGAGIFGASTALHLKAARPKAQVTLIDRSPYPCPYGASFDLNKIVRDYYTDKFYMQLANEAQLQWRNEDKWNSFYHETGLFVADDTGLGRKLIQNYQDLHMDHRSEIITPEEIGKRWDGVYKDINLDGVKEIYWNARCGWADASGALKYAIKTAIESGVTYKEGEMTSLLLDDSRSCYGVRLKDESELLADHIVLCTGAHTAKLLADSAPQWEELQVKNRVLAVGVVAAYVRLTSDQMERFKAMPVYVGAMPDVKGTRKRQRFMGEKFLCINLTIMKIGGLLPPTPERLLKIARDESFSHYVHHKASDQTLSVPPKFKNQTAWGPNVPQGLKEECKEILRKSLGEQAEGLEIESYRLCWYVVSLPRPLIYLVECID